MDRLQDVDDLRLEISDGDSGHDLDHERVHSALKTMKATTPLSTYISLVEPSTYNGVTVTVSTAPPSWIGVYVPASLQGIRFTVPGPPLVAAADSSYWASWNGSDLGANVVSHEEAFFMQGSRVCGMFMSYGDMDFQFIIDGLLAKSSYSVLPNVVGPVFISLEFTDDTSPNKVRNIRGLFGQMGLYQWLLPAGGDIWADNTRRYTFGICAADSYYHGAGGTTEGSISGGTLANEMSILTGGKTTTINAGACGGTGYMNPATGTAVALGPNNQSPFGSTRRKNAASQWISEADCLIVAGGANDADKNVYAPSAVVAAANQTWSDYAAMAPGKPLIVIGIQSGVFQTVDADLTALNNMLREAALSHPNVTAFIDDRAALMQYGSGHIANKTGDGIADVMRSSDSVHLSRFGNRQVARKRIPLMSHILVDKI